MKKIKILSVVSLSILMSVFTSCVPDPGLDNETPTISVSVQGTPTYEAGSTITYKIILGTPNTELKTLTVEGSGSYQPAPGSGVTSTSPTEKWDDSEEEFVKGTSNVTVYYDVKIGSDLSNGNQIFLKFEVTDDLFETDEEEITITVGDDGNGNSGTEMTGEVNATIYNFLQGPLPSGWDMINDAGAAYSTNQSNIDIYNRTNVFNDDGYNNTYGFTPAYWTLNETYIVRTNISYATATLEDVVQAYNNGTKLSTEAMTSTNEVYVARLRGGSTYAIIQTTNVGYTSSDKNDYLSFKYKKGQ